jgi:hypothetical protein
MDGNNHTMPMQSASIRATLELKNRSVSHGNPGSGKSISTHQRPSDSHLAGVCHIQKDPLLPLLPFIFDAVAKAGCQDGGRACLYACPEFYRVVFFQGHPVMGVGQGIAASQPPSPDLYHCLSSQIPYAREHDQTNDYQTPVYSHSACMDRQ